MQDGAEGQTVPPGSAEVGDLYPRVAVGDALTPLEQGLAGGHQGLEEEEEEEAGMKRTRPGHPAGHCVYCVYRTACMVCVVCEYLSCLVLPISLLSDHGDVVGGLWLRVFFFC